MPVPNLASARFGGRRGGLRIPRRAIQAAALLLAMGLAAAAGYSGLDPFAPSELPAGAPKGRAPDGAAPAVMLAGHRAGPSPAMAGRPPVPAGDLRRATT